MAQPDFNRLEGLTKEVLAKAFGLPSSTHAGMANYHDKQAAKLSTGGMHEEAGQHAMAAGMHRRAAILNSATYPGPNARMASADAVSMSHRLASPGGMTSVV